MTQIPSQVEQQCVAFRDTFQSLRDEIGKVIVGHHEVVDNVLTALFCGGHVLLEGVPGLGKTLLVRTLAAALALKFRRVQFTPDLMPADIIGTHVLIEEPGAAGGMGRRQLQFQPGPIFGQIILADEINRATPKTQSAMLEAMQEHSVTTGGTIHALPEPFFVLATQNPIEQEGTYPLPEAQLDRFFFKLVVTNSSREELGAILDRTTTGGAKASARRLAGKDGSGPAGPADVKPVLDAAGIAAAQELVCRVAIAPHVQDYAIRLVLATHPGGPFAQQQATRYVRFGSSPRGLQAVVLAGKVRALLDGRYNVSFDDLAAAYLPAMRHRVLLNFEGQAEGVSNDQLLTGVLLEVPRGAVA